MGLFGDNDAIYKQIDQLQAEGKYEQILEKIESVPEKKMSNKLWFKKIQAMNALGRFKEARREIGLLSKRCSEPKEDAMLFYLMGNTFEYSGHALKAMECYRKTQEFDPGFDGISGRIDSCRETAKQEFGKINDAFGQMFSEVDAAFSEAKDQKKLEYPIALNYASMIGSSFIPSGTGLKLPLDDPFFKCEDKEINKNVKDYLERKYGVSDVKSLQQWYGNNRMAPTIQGVRNALSNNIPMPVEKMDAKSIAYFESIVFSLNSLEEFLPEEGVIAWDFNVVIALARLLFAVGSISNTEFCEASLFFTDECKRNFSSWKDYAHSVIIGGYFNALFEMQYDVSNATMFGTVASRICKENYPKVTWIN
ncbi:MAG: DUF1266 domain-containing protein [Clostridiales bacterium]|nr:DUF1266 domain-containing protein [Clostridiales bacterium]